MWWNRIVAFVRAARSSGLLGLNGRHLRCVYDHNPRGKRVLVDDKLLAKELLVGRGIPCPETYAVFRTLVDVSRVEERLAGRTAFAIKPTNGFGGGGILQIAERHGDEWICMSGRVLRTREVQDHLRMIQSGMYSIAQKEDTAMAEVLIRPLPIFGAATGRPDPPGVPDVRVIMYRREPAMAMLRCPTLVSDGKANLQAGGIGLGIDLSTGRTTSATFRRRFIARHPDLGVAVTGVTVPHWERVLEISRQCAAAFPLGYLGVDVTLDVREGPLVLELNGRPGLLIQIANLDGLKTRLDEIDRRLSSGARVGTVRRRRELAPAAA